MHSSPPQISEGWSQEATHQAQREERVNFDPDIVFGLRGMISVLSSIVFLLGLSVYSFSSRPEVVSEVQWPDRPPLSMQQQWGSVGRSCPSASVFLSLLSVRWIYNQSINSSKSGCARVCITLIWIKVYMFVHLTLPDHWCHWTLTGGRKFISTRY